MKKEVRIMKKPQRRFGGSFAAAKSIETPSTTYSLPNTKYQIPNTKYQSGSIALYLVMIVAILLMTTTTIAARLSVGELAQASEVDLSDAAYYAAEAGIEEASRRLDVNDDVELEIPRIFPEQFANGADGGTQHGDRAVLINDSGSSVIGSLLTIDQDTDHGTHYGLVAWRQRKVYEEPINPFGTLLVDESVELDATNLRRECPEGSRNYRGADGWDCEGSPTSIFASLNGVKLCWTPSSGVNPDIEMTTLSYPANDITNITTEKMLINPLAGIGSGIHVNVYDGGDPDGVYDRCASIEVNDKNRRYIFRIRPLHAGISYRTELLDDRNGFPGPLFLANNTVLIDSIGQVGDVRRRIIARKQRNGRILGIFDYVLYSGDPVLPLCKPGVDQDDEPGPPPVPGVEYENCIVAPANQSSPSPSPAPSPSPSPSPSPAPAPSPSPPPPAPSPPPPSPSPRER